MNEFVGEYQYVIAWSVYLASGFVFCLCWWRLTGLIKHSGWRDLLRGISLVVIFTPWFAGEAHEHYAPVVVIVSMDLLLGSTENGLAGSLVLLMACAVMLGALIVRRLVTARSP